MIRVLTVDDHVAVRAGVHGVLRTEPGIVPVGSASGVGELLPMLHRTRPDVVVVDHHLADGNGLALTRQIKAVLPSPGVLLYSAYADESLLLPAALAGADAMLAKSSTADELFDTIRAVSRGESLLERPAPARVAGSLEHLDHADRAIAAMRLDGASATEIANALGVEPPEVDTRIDRMISRLGRDTRPTGE